MRPARVRLCWPKASDASSSTSARRRLASRGHEMSWRSVPKPCDHDFTRASVARVSDVVIS